MKWLSIFLGVFSLCGLHADFVPFDGRGSDLSPRTEFAYSSGWRWDRVDVLERNFVDGPSGSSRDHNRHLGIWEYGIRGALAIPTCYTECGWDWLSQFYVNGYAYWGTITSGTLSHSSFNANEDLVLRERRHVRDGQTHNYQVGGGWLFPITCEFGIAPTGGYAWDDITVRPSNLRSTSGSSSVCSDRYFRQNWQGPYAGVDLVYDLFLCGCNNIRLNGGYEHHWIESTTRILNSTFSVNPSTCAFRSLKAEKHGHAQVGYLNASWDFCDCWAIKVGGKYRYFRASSSSASFKPEELVGCPSSRLKPKWRSWEVTFDLAYHF